MAQRDLIAVSTGRVVGAVRAGDKETGFTGSAGPIFREIRGKLGDDTAAATLIEDGWSNGYLYLGSVR